VTVFAQSHLTCKMFVPVADVKHQSIKTTHRVQLPQFRGSTEVKNVWSYTSASLYDSVTLGLVKQRENCVFLS
jgi:hypothetical protein